MLFEECFVIHFLKNLLQRLTVHRSLQDRMLKKYCLRFLWNDKPKNDDADRL